MKQEVFLKCNNIDNIKNEEVNNLIKNDLLEIICVIIILKINNGDK